MKFHPSVLFTSAIVVTMAFVVYVAKDFPFLSKAYPLFIGSVGLILSVLLLIAELRRLAAGSDLNTRMEGTDMKSSYNMKTLSPYKNIAVALAWILGLYLAIWLVGFRLAITVFFITYLSIKSPLRWYMIPLLTVLMLIFIICFDKFLEVEWPEGILSPWLPWSR